MCGRNVLYQFRRTNEPADAPAGTVEILTRGADCERTSGYGGGESSHAGEGGIGEAVVDFVGEDEDVVFYAEVADGLELGFGEYFTDGVVAGTGLIEIGTSGKRREAYGVLITIIFVFGLIAASSKDMSIVQSAAEDTSVPPFLGGCRGT